MADKEEMAQVNSHLALTPDMLTHEMGKCETDVADAAEWEASLEEVISVPDVQRTSFLWEIRVPPEKDLEGWEAEEGAECWRCLPAHWQSILNAKLCAWHAAVQDGEAFYIHRQAEFGDGHIKTKNAKDKFEALQSGDGAESIILFSKATGKECSQDVYTKSVIKQKGGGHKIQISNKVRAFCLNVKDMTLRVADVDGGLAQPKQLRVVSVTGRSKAIQELRVHLSALGLVRAHVLPNTGKQKVQQNPKEPEGGHLAIEANIYIYYIGEEKPTAVSRSQLYI